MIEGGRVELVPLGGDIVRIISEEIYTGDYVINYLRGTR